MGSVGSLYHQNHMLSHVEVVEQFRIGMSYDSHQQLGTLLANFGKGKIEKKGDIPFAA